MHLLVAVLYISTCLIKALRVPDIRSVTYHPGQNTTAAGNLLAGRRTSNLQSNTTVGLLSQLSSLTVVFQSRRLPLHTSIWVRLSKPPLHNLSPGNSYLSYDVCSGILPYVLTVCVIHCCESITVGRTSCWLEILAN